MNAVMRLIFLLACVAVCDFAWAAAAGWRPERPVRLLVPGAPGTQIDLLAHALAGPMGEALHGELVVKAQDGTITTVRQVEGTVTAVSAGGLLWSLVAIALVTLVPTRPDVGIVPAETRSDTCSWDYGGPSGAAFEVLGLDRLRRAPRTVVTLVCPSGGRKNRVRPPVAPRPARSV